MNHQKGLAPILIVLLIALALGGYLIYQRQPKPTPAPQQTTQSISIPTPSSVPNNSRETANWKAYQNQEFSFKYPSDWEIESQSSPVVRLTKKGSPQPISASPSSGGFVGRPESYPEGYVRISIGNEFQSLTTGREGSTQKEIRLGDRRALLLEYPSNSYLDHIFAVVYEKDSEEEWGEIHLETTNLTTFRLIFDQILSTFKFTQ